MDRPESGTHAASMVRVGAALRRARVDAGVSLEVLGDRIGESGATISRWETAKRDIRIDYVVRIEEALTLPKGYIWRTAGLCDPCEGLVEAIANDATLNRAGREVLRSVYLTLLENMPGEPHEATSQ